VLTRGSESTARHVVAAFSDARTTLAAVCPWASGELSKPLAILMLEDAQITDALGPKYAGTTGGLFETPDRFFIVLRTDGNDDGGASLESTLRPAFFAYADLALRTASGHPLPFWLERGLAALLSNSARQGNALVIGAASPDVLASLESEPLSLSLLFSMKADDAAFNNAEALEEFTANGWAFVNFSLFAENGANRAAFVKFLALVRDGADPTGAIVSAFGALDSLEPRYRKYVQDGHFHYGQAPAPPAEDLQRTTEQPTPDSEVTPLLALLRQAADSAPPRPFSRVPIRLGNGIKAPAKIRDVGHSHSSIAPRWTRSGNGDSLRLCWTELPFPWS
jgi:hypothetical protein